MPSSLSAPNSASNLPQPQGSAVVPQQPSSEEPPLVLHVPAAARHGAGTVPLAPSTQPLPHPGPPEERLPHELGMQALADARRARDSGNRNGSEAAHSHDFHRQLAFDVFWSVVRTARDLTEGRDAALSPEESSAFVKTLRTMARELATYRRTYDVPRVAIDLSPLDLPKVNEFLDRTLGGHFDFGSLSAEELRDVMTASQELHLTFDPTPLVNVLQARVGSAPRDFAVQSALAVAYARDISCYSQAHTVQDILKTLDDAARAWEQARAITATERFVQQTHMQLGAELSSTFASGKFPFDDLPKGDLERLRSSLRRLQIRPGSMQIETAISRLEVFERRATEMIAVHVQGLVQVLAKPSRLNEADVAEASRIMSTIGDIQRTLLTQPESMPGHCFDAALQRCMKDAKLGTLRKNLEALPEHSSDDYVLVAGAVFALQQER